jgi:hypothetical protein
MPAGAGCLRRHPVFRVVADDRLAVDDARADRQLLDRLSDTRKAIRKVVAIAGEKPNIAPAPMRQDPEAVVLDLVYPARALPAALSPIGEGTVLA